MAKLLRKLWGFPAGHKVKFHPRKNLGVAKGGADHDQPYIGYLEIEGANTKRYVTAADRGTLFEHSMKTESTPPVSGVAAFLGEAAAPEATTTVTFTGTQKAVAKAIAGMAKKPAKKAPPAPGDTPLPPVGDEAPSVEGDLEIDVTPEGDDELPPLRGPRDESRAVKAADIVEALLQDQPAAK